MNSREIIVEKVNCSERWCSIFIHRSKSLWQTRPASMRKHQRSSVPEDRERYFIFVSTGMFKDAATYRAYLVTAEDIYFKRLQFILFYGVEILSEQTGSALGRFHCSVFQKQSRRDSTGEPSGLLGQHDFRAGTCYKPLFVLCYIQICFCCSFFLYRDYYWQWSKQAMHKYK
jgi:hypothetical protein